MLVLVPVQVRRQEKTDIPAETQLGRERALSYSAFYCRQAFMDWLRPPHTGEGDLLYLSTDSGVDPIQKHPQDTPRNNV